jgi:hypothetical protein
MFFGGRVVVKTQWKNSITHLNKCFGGNRDTMDEKHSPLPLVRPH